MVFNLDIYSAVSLVQRVKPRMVIDTRSLVKVAGSKATLSRALTVLKKHGFVRGSAKGWVAFIDVIWQPMYVIESILPSLKAFVEAKSIRCSKKILNYREDLFVTLDWKAWELTGYQTPKNLYIYADSLEEVKCRLGGADQGNIFGAGEELVYVLPKIGEFHNPIERTYLDCIARGGRSWLDAIAIELLYSHKLRVRASFPVELVEKVIEDLNSVMRKGERSGWSRAGLKRVQLIGGGRD